MPEGRIVHKKLMKNESEEAKVDASSMPKTEEIGLTVQQVLILGYMVRKVDEHGEIESKAVRAGMKKEQDWEDWTSGAFAKMTSRMEESGYLRKYEGLLELTAHGRFVFGKALERMRRGLKGLKDTAPKETFRAGDSRLDQGDAYIGPQDDAQAVETIPLQSHTNGSSGLIHSCEPEISPVEELLTGEDRKAANMERLKSLNLGSLGITNGKGETI